MMSPFQCVLYPTVCFHGVACVHVIHVYVHGIAVPQPEVWAEPNTHKDIHVCRQVWVPTPPEAANVFFEK